MFCKKCYADLSTATGDRCPKCKSRFDRNEPRSFRDRPFPRKWEVVGSVLLTTFVACVVAFGVAFHQAARTSGH